MKEKNIDMYYAFDSKLFILSILYLILCKSKKQRMEVIKLFIMIPILMENTISTSYKTKNKFSYMIQKTNSDISKSNFYIKTNDYIYKYREKIFQSILYGLKIGLFELYFEKELYIVLKYKPKNFKSLKENKFLYKIKKLVVFCENIEIRDIVKDIKLEEL